MSQATQSPGPWKWVNMAPKAMPGMEWWELQDANGKTVCDDGSSAGEYAQAIDPRGPDAALIAAAPDLLAALKEAEVIYRALLLACKKEPKKGGTLERAQAAIAKAEGRA